MLGLPRVKIAACVPESRSAATEPADRHESRPALEFPPAQLNAWNLQAACKRGGHAVPQRLKVNRRQQRLDT